MAGTIETAWAKQQQVEGSSSAHVCLRYSRAVRYGLPSRVIGSKRCAFGQLLPALAPLAAAAASREAFRPCLAMSLMRTEPGWGAVPNMASTCSRQEGGRGQTLF